MHMNKYRTILWMLLVGLSASLNAQQPSLFTSGVETNPEFKNFYFQVKHIEDFMSRFNGETNVMDSTQIEGWRYKNLLFLFDEQTYYANEALADTLIHRQLDSACRLDYTASNWSAVAECNVLYKKAKNREGGGLYIQMGDYGCAGGDIGLEAGETQSGSAYLADGQ